MKNQFHPCLTLMASLLEAEELPWMLQDLGADAVEMRDESTMSKEGSGRTMLIAGFLNAQRRDKAVKELSATGMEVSPLNVEDDGWSLAWREFFKPVIFETLQIVTPWMEPPFKDHQTIIVDPGQAFGTGGHPTTKLLVHMLEKRSGTIGLPQRVLDVGVGSGVLSIAAIKLGAAHALGVDIDEESVLATLENANVNNVSEQIEAVQGTARDLNGQWPLVLANIELRVFLEHAVDIAPLVESGGELLVSGLLDDQVAQCVALWPGFTVEETTFQDGWSAVSLRRSA